MGEVYKARDNRLGRDVALKVLPAGFAADADRMRRFEQEARATGMLNHPNILAVYDVGMDEGSPYLVTELLVGTTLREQLPLTRRKALDYAAQIAMGLAAAHAKCVTHRDLKPENLFITNDGRAKILDFGLAKVALTDPASGDAASTRSMYTMPGVALGTVGYMSPEQVLGKPADARSDIFSLGAILYEMFGEHRAFQRPSTVETLNAILKDDPPPLADLGFERIVRRCLDKSPEQRFQSASDLAFAISNQGEAPSGIASQMATSAKRRYALSPFVIGAAILGLAAAFAAGFLIAGRGTAKSTIRLHRLTFRAGTISAARFTRDGQGIVYDASWNGNPPEVFSSRPEDIDGRPLGLAQTSLLSVSHSGELAVLTRSRSTMHMSSIGTLARAPMAGGAPREIAEGISEADWAPDGSDMLLLRNLGGRQRLEYPPGKVLVETNGWISHARFSPRGDHIAYLDHPVPIDDLGSVVMVDLAGNRTTLATGWIAAEGLAWAPDGSEIWFTGASGPDEDLALRAVTTSGKQRLVLRLASGLMIYDISRSGDILVGRYDQRYRLLATAPGDSRERDLSWLDQSSAADISRDGRTVLFTEFNFSAQYAAALRKTDGSPVVRLGDGNALALSADEKWAITLSAVAPQHLSVVPTGTGEPRKLNTGGVTNYYRMASWFPDAKRIVFVGGPAGRKVRSYALHLSDSTAGGQPRAITPEGVWGTLLSPDGRFLVARDDNGRYSLYPIQGGEPAPLRGLRDEDLPVQWSTDGKTIYILENSDWPARIVRLDIATGRRQEWKEVVPADRAGLTGVSNSFRNTFRVTPDGKVYAYTVVHTLSILYLMQGLN
jgi:Tol biopolymer transport system component